MKKYDAVVIGTGQSGPSLATRLAGAGWDVAIVERDKFGGTCVNDGCIPTKALVASAKAIPQAKCLDFPRRVVSMWTCSESRPEKMHWRANLAAM
jgi:pyruvate/2-oxoglutarate dehydrogenase complex dihydrolipoamide dehydrogenase (E3) component